MATMTIEELQKQIKTTEARIAECSKRISDVLQASKLTAAGEIPRATTQALKQARLESKSAIQELAKLNRVVQAMARKQRK